MSRAAARPAPETERVRPVGGASKRVGGDRCAAVAWRRRIVATGFADARGTVAALASAVADAADAVARDWRVAARAAKVVSTPAMARIGSGWADART